MLAEFSRSNVNNNVMDFLPTTTYVDQITGSTIEYFADETTISRIRANSKIIVQKGVNADECMNKLSEKMKEKIALFKAENNELYFKLTQLKDILPDIFAHISLTKKYEFNEQNKFNSLTFLSSYFTEKEIVNLSRICLFVIDMQNGFSDDSSDLPVKGMIQAGNQISNIRQNFHFHRVFETIDVHTSDSLTFSTTHGISNDFPCVTIIVCYNRGTTNETWRELLVWRRHCVKNTESQERFDTTIYPHENHILIEKGNKTEEYSPIANEAGEPNEEIINMLLQHMSIAIVTGVAEGGFCVTTTIYHLRALGFPVIKLIDATAAIDVNGSKHLHEIKEESDGVITLLTVDLLNAIKLHDNQ